MAAAESDVMLVDNALEDDLVAVLRVDHSDEAASFQPRPRVRPQGTGVGRLLCGDTPQLPYLAIGDVTL